MQYERFFLFQMLCMIELMNILCEEFQQLRRTEMRREAIKNKTRIQEIFTILRENYPRNEENDETEIDSMSEFPLESVENYVQFNGRLKN